MELSDGWNNLAVKNISGLLRGITSKHHGDCLQFYLNCLHSFRTKNKLKSQKEVCEKKFFVISSEDTKILEFNQYQKSDKAPFIIYVDLECLKKKRFIM